MKTQPYHIVRTSKIHGRGVFAKRPVRTGIRVLEYNGPIISEKEADDIGISTDKEGHSHTMLFQISKKRVINGNEGGDARYVNHGCDPNCETEQDGDKIFIKSVRAIKQGEELVYDYHLQVPGKITDKEKKEYACYCGSPDCRGTQIAATILAKQAKKDEKKRKKQEEEKKKQGEKKIKQEEKKLNKKKKSAEKDRKKKKKISDKADLKKKKQDKGKKKVDALSLMVDQKLAATKTKKKDSKKKDPKKKISV
ncbi:MAG: SET domain-containing protein-lysine N-methyltransferase [Saprospiraceae bacterium]|nr:SET domain-containing protein-lysine N-methyltransferase [Saprospiraceae bacterium]